MDPTDLAFAGAAAQARMLADGALTAPMLLEVYLQRIERLDSHLRAYRVVQFDRARAEAEAAQQRLDAGERLPLLGVPIAIKDDVDIAGEVTTYGSAGHGPAATSDAEVVRRLRAAGAVIIGKTNVPELMIMPFTESLAFGATRNPWCLNRTPGGSSSGSAAAVAAGLAPVALGSDGGGSIRIPCTWCGLFGLKPQRDRISWSRTTGLAGAERQWPDRAVGNGRGVATGRDHNGAWSRRRVCGRGRTPTRPAANCLEHQGANPAAR